MTTTSDFFYCTSTHDLLLRVLFSELGLLPVASPHSIYLGVVLAFEDLRTSLTSDLSEMVRCEMLDVDVSRSSDMVLFYDLYTSINFLSSCGCDVETMIDQGIFPAVAKMIATEDNVAQLIKERCNNHAQQYGDLVKHRMNKTLKSINVNSYIRVGEPNVQSSNN